MILERGRKRVSAWVSGEQVFGSIREIWVRDVYLRTDFLTVAPGATVVDLGANVGVFTILALAHDPGVRVIAVEPNREFNEQFRLAVTRNGWSDRVTLIRAFIGGRTAVQSAVTTDARYHGAPYVETAQFLARYGIRRIDFLKCDIEGSEFELLTPASPLLAITEQLAIELHEAAGDPKEFVNMLESAGFKIGFVKQDAGSCIVHARRNLACK